MPHSLPQSLEVMPEKLKAIVALMRLSSPWGTFLLILPCWWGLAAAGSRDIGVYALFALGGLLMRSFGCVVNDLWDRNIDAKVARTAARPLASGALGVRTAIAVAASLLAAAFLVLMRLPSALLGWAVAVTPLVLAYPLAKRFFFLPQLLLGITFNWGVWMGWLAALRPLGLETLWLYLAAVCWTIFYDGIYSLQDAKDDEELGLKSFAIYFRHRIKVVLAIFALLSVTFFVLAGGAAAGPLSLPMTVVIAAIFCYRLWALVVTNPSSAAIGFKRSVWIGVAGVMAWLG